jgi:pSer/pThr/pTyr-binding forkhead associated (FHA) protein
MRVITIGRGSANDVSINDGLVSRHHLQIIQDDNGNFRIADFGSKNGTFVNGRQISGEIALSRSDVVRIGNTTLAWKDHFPDIATPRQSGHPTPPPPVVIPQSPIIPENININKNERIEYSNVLRKGDDFKVNFNRNVGDKMGNAVGGTLGCLVSILIIAAIIALIALFAF